jgi:hypothetical protein
MYETFENKIKKISTVKKWVILRNRVTNTDSQTHRRKTRPIEMHIAAYKTEVLIKNI